MNLNAKSVLTIQIQMTNLLSCVDFLTLAVHIHLHTLGWKKRNKGKV